MGFDIHPGISPRTQAVRRALAAMHDHGAAADFMFLEQWVAQPTRDIAATLRASQIRRANPSLAEAIQQELAVRR